ncbi:MAG: hypothetical protein K5681_10125 [Treponema sp.]|nr:hypothetical protein [Treponema sp.]
MKKKILLLSVLFISFFAHAFEWGGLLSDDTKLSSDLSSISFHQSNNLSIWANINFNQSGNTYLSAQGSVKYYWDISKDSNDFLPVYNLDLLKFVTLGKFGSSAAIFSMGRFSVSDLTSKVFSQPLDGISLELSFPIVNMGLYAGYSGLLNTSEVLMMGQGGEIQDSSCNYIPVNYTLIFPSLLANQTFALQLSSIIDISTENYNRAYGTLLFKGPIAGPLSYSVSTTVGSEKFKNLMNLSELSLSFIPTPFLQLSANATYASGSQLFLSPFVGFTSYTAYNSIMYPELSGVLLPAISLSLIHKNICGLINVAAVMPMPEQSISFKGVDFSLALIFNIFSDLQLNFRAAGFYDLSKVTNETNIIFDLSASMSF